MLSTKAIYMSTEVIQLIPIIAFEGKNVHQREKINKEILIIYVSA